LLNTGISFIFNLPVNGGDWIELQQNSEVNEWEKGTQHEAFLQTRHLSL
jgi:hypothetical protein